MNSINKKINKTKLEEGRLAPVGLLEENYNKPNINIAPPTNKTETMEEEAYTNTNTPKPIVLVTSPDRGGTMAWFFISMQIKLAGGIPLRIQPKHKKTIDSFDALVISGGTDIHPDNYLGNKTKNKPPSKTKIIKKSTKTRFKEALKYPLEFVNNLLSNTKTTYDIDRDKMEKKYLEQAYKKDLPILGICRGHQLIHAYFGGQILRNTNEVYKNKPRIRSLFARKKISIDKCSHQIQNIMGPHSTKVNALHNQSVEQVAPDFQVVAREKNGIIQATEHTDPKKCLICVQWHPEYLVGKKEQRKLFQYLISHALKTRREKDAEL